MIEHPIKSFTWRGKCGTAEISSLSHPFMKPTDSNDKASPWGFYVVNPVTKVKKFFKVVAVERPRKDALLWKFASADGLTITLFND